MRIRLIRISLAVKYRILFGLAVLMIIGAALYLPWHVLYSLVQEQPYREAKRIADNYFRTTLGTTTLAGGAHSQEPGLLENQASKAAQFVRATATPDDPASLVNVVADHTNRAFVFAAMKKFFVHPRRDQHYQTVETPEGTRFVYARAIRVSKSCLDCHAPTNPGTTPFSDNQLAGLILVDLPFDQSQEQILFSRLAILAAGLLAGALAILVFSVIVRKFILSPIHELREVAVRVTGGDLDVRSTVETGDEFQQLSDNLNAMLEQLRSQQEELRKANVLLDEKLGQMAETNVALYEANRVKSEFLANVTHELRTPLTSIIGFAELLGDPAGGGNGKAARYAENILISGRILLEIINDLLDLAKIEAGKVELKLEPVRIDELCGTLVDFLRPLADKRLLSIDLEITPEIPMLVTDRGRLRQILFNLLSNAIKFTPEGGRISLRAARATPDGARIEIQDSGPGIAAEHQKIIFDKFRQIDGSATREHHGTGLGLAIAKELTTILGGEIGVISDVGAGAIFWVRLPSAVSEAAVRPKVSLV